MKQLHQRFVVAGLSVLALVLGVALLGYRTGEDAMALGPRPVVPPPPVAAEPPVDWVTPDRNPHMEWSNPGDMANVWTTRMNVWKYAGSAKIFVNTFNLGGTAEGVDLTPTAANKVPILDHLMTLDNGKYVVTLFYSNSLGRPGPESAEIPLAWAKTEAPQVIPVNPRITVTQLSGDINADGEIDIADVMHLINYLYHGGEKPAPCPMHIIWAQHGKV